jgi:hypothetical protein
MEADAATSRQELQAQIKQAALEEDFKRQKFMNDMELKQEKAAMKQQRQHDAMTAKIEKGKQDQELVGQGQKMDLDMAAAKQKESAAKETKEPAVDIKPLLDSHKELHGLLKTAIDTMSKTRKVTVVRGKDGKLTGEAISTLN